MSEINNFWYVYFLFVPCYYKFYTCALTRETYSDFETAERLAIDQYSIGSIVIKSNDIQDSRGFIIPAPRGDFLKPTGFRVSIPDVEGMEKFYFNGNINKKFFLNNNPYLVPQIVEIIDRVSNDGRWGYENRTIDIRKGDTVFYWVAISMVNGSFYFSYNHNLTKFID